jgi:C1A family cysteine protease
MINHVHVRLAFLASVALLLVCPAAVFADDETARPSDSLDLIQPPGVYPLISENDVEIRPIIKPSAYDLTPSAVKRDFPVTFDLRSVDGHNYTTPVKSQSGGTCWTHGTMAAIESQTLISGAPWIAYLPAQTYPCMDEYHLDWWNGFNQHYNADIYPITGEGLEVHQGGDYLVSAAYFARNDGAVDRYLTSGTLYTGTYSSPADYTDPNYDYYFPREIEWLTAGTELENIDAIKEALQADGVVATAICWSGSFYNSSTRTFYQPPSDPTLPNHSVAISGWNDTLSTQAPVRGAWLCKNSWGASWGQAGYFWVSYYDKVAGHHPEMGAVTFHDLEIVGPRQVYFHDYHGWRDTREELSQGLAVFTTVNERMISDASFITAADNVDYLVQVYDAFDPTEGPTGLLATAQGTAAHIGLHTVALDHQIRLPSGEDFFVALTLSAGGLAFDRTSLIPVLLGTEEEDVLVRSASSPNESFYYDNSAWVDLYEDDTTASFCIKALADKSSPVGVINPVGPAPSSVTFSASWLYGDVLGYRWQFDDGTESTEPSPTRSFDQLGLHDVIVNLTTSDGEVSILHKRAYGIHADTITVSSVLADAGSSVKLDIDLNNVLPLGMMVIPFTWDGPLDLAFDSISIAGCRMEVVGSVQFVEPVPPSKSAAIIWECDQTDRLEAGSGPVISLHFTASGGVPGEVNPVRIAGYGVYSPQIYAIGLADYLPTLVDGGIRLDCCVERVGDANGSGEDEPTIGDVSVMIDAKFITGSCEGILDCPAEADVNQSGGAGPTCEDVTVGDISMLIDYLFVTGSSLGLPDCF